MWDILLPAAAWLQELPPIKSLRASAWTYPLVNATHILGFALLFGAIAVADLAILRRGRLAAANDLAVRVALAGFALAAATGVVLFAVRALAYLQNPFMLAKVILIVLAGLNAFTLRRLARNEDRSPDGAIVQRACAAASLGFWMAAIVSGRLIGFW